MQNITFSADARLIEAARERARREGTTLNEEFRRWLTDYAGSGRPASKTFSCWRSSPSTQTRAGGSSPAKK